MSATTPPLDVVTFGETMLRLSPPPGYGLENAAMLEVFSGGAESNMAIALARLGGRVGWFSRLPDTPIGRRIADEIGRHGVDTSRIVWAEDARAGLLFIETGTAPRGNRVLYDRADAAIAHLRPEAVDWDYVTAAGTLFLSGITPALGPTVRETWHEAIRRAKAAGMRLVLDVNYRGKLWTPAAARDLLEPLLGQVDVLISAHRDLRTIFGAGEDPERAAAEFAAAHGIGCVVLTLGADGALAYDGGLHRHPGFRVEPWDRIGAGDAFAAGLLKGLGEGDLARGLALGNAGAALKQTFRGDTTWASGADVAELIASGGADASLVRR